MTTYGLVERFAVCLMRVSGLLAAFGSLFTSSPQTIPEIYVPTPNYGSPVASQQLLYESIGTSWGQHPGVNYEPPAVNFDYVKLNVEYDISGTQYDRLGHIYLNGIEVWRPSTPEPGRRTVVGKFTKDVSHLLPLFQNSGNVSIQVDNTVNNQYTGYINVTVSADYYQAQPSANYIQEANWYASSAPSQVYALNSYLASIPPSQSLSLPQLPSNVTQAVLQVYASGNGNEEFWYASNTSPGPARLVNLTINGVVAGIADPFFEIYTGGVNYPSWSALVGIHAYDVPAYYIDVTPFLPTLWAGESELNVDVSTELGMGPAASDWLLNVGLITWQVAGSNNSGTAAETTYEGPITNPSSEYGELVTARNSVRNSANLVLNGQPTYVEWLQNITQKYSFNATGSYGVGEGAAEVVRNSDVWSRSHMYAVGLPSPSGQSNINQGYAVAISKPEGTFTVSDYVESIHNGDYQGPGGTNTSVCVEAAGSFGVFSEQAQAINSTIVSQKQYVACPVTVPGYVGSIDFSPPSLRAANLAAAHNTSIVTVHIAGGVGRAPAFLLDR